MSAIGPLYYAVKKFHRIDKAIMYQYDHSKPFTPIGYTNFRNTNKLFGIKLQDRFSHIYSIGKTGSGKTTLLLNMAIDDIHKGYGVALIEPHGDACVRN